jgi:hypothetical protein
MTFPDPVRLWRPVDVVAVGLGNAAGLVVILAAWAGAGHEIVPDRQVGWVDLGIAGLLVITVADTLWLLAGRRACWRLRHALLPAERGLPWPGGAALSGPPAAAAATALVASDTMTWYHAGHCAMVAGKPVAAASEAEHRSAGRRPCAACLPPEAERP